MQELQKEEAEISRGVGSEKQEPLGFTTALTREELEQILGNFLSGTWGLKEAPFPKRRDL